MKNIFICIVGLVLLLSCHKENTSLNSDPIVLSAEQKQIVGSSNSFGLDLLKEVADESGDGENIFISPLSVSMALSMLYNGAAGTTLDELREGLGYSSLTDSQVNVANRDLIKALLKADSKVIMNVANSIWYRNTFNPEPAFIKVNQDYLNAEVESAAFDDGTKDLINNWVKQKTNGKITGIVDQIPAQTVMYLINAIYFKGVWKYQFEKDKTQSMTFTKLNSTTLEADFMQQEGTFEYLSNDLFTAANLPYGSGNYSMVVLVPNNQYTYKDILAAMTKENWDSWNKSLTERSDVKIYLPKFKLSYKNELNGALSALGMPTMFSDEADLSRINSSVPLSVTKVMHKTYVEVNEEGTEAAAVTSVEVGVTSAGPGEGLILKADKPFIYVIKEKDTNTLLFMGILNEPLIEN